MSHVLADARDHPVMAPYHAHWQRAADILTAPWRLAAAVDRMLHAAIALALSFDTWRTLTREQGLSDDQAIAVMLRLTRDCEPAAPAARRWRPDRPAHRRLAARARRKPVRPHDQRVLSRAVPTGGCRHCIKEPVELSPAPRAS